MYSEFVSGVINTGSLIAIANAAQIISTSNIFENCYTATSGAVLQLNNSNFYDYNSSFI